MKRILVIDDEELTLNLLKTILEEEGYEVVEAYNGEDGLALFRHQPTDMIITDMVMPVKDGLKTILEVREIDKTIPVIAISGGGAITKERYLSIAGCLENVHALAKPFSREELLEQVEKLINR